MFKEYDYSLGETEFFWVEQQSFLLSRGYKLRPRYAPGWVGSWKSNGKPAMYCEDSRSNRPWNVIDAIRVQDDVKVCLKLVPTWTEQVPISLYLSSDRLRRDPRNRTVQILDVVTVPSDDDWALLIMPFLREFDDPPFRYLAECIEVLRQILQGLVFMHEHDIAHRDACSGNIMMDTTRLIPGGFHHVVRNSKDGVTRLGSKITDISRLSVAPVDYYFIDFGLSSRFPSYDERRLVTGTAGQNKKVPEQSATVPYDPFKLDIFQMGGIVKELVETYHGLRLFRPLAKTMSHPQPGRRPSAADALQQFESIVSKLSPSASKARVVPYEKWIPTMVWRNVRDCVSPRRSSS